MSVPQSYSAVESNGNSVLFYAKRDGTVASLVQKGSGQQYDAQDVVTGGKTVTTDVPYISAVAYTDKWNKKQIRVYYIAKNRDEDKYQLKEICRTDGGFWYEGALDTNYVWVSEKSRIAANVEYGQGDLKVFYLNERDLVYEVSVSLTDERWYTPRLVYKFGQ